MAGEMKLPLIDLTTLTLEGLLNFLIHIELLALEI